VGIQKIMMNRDPTLIEKMKFSLVKSNKNNKDIITTFFIVFISEELERRIQDNLKRIRYEL